MGIEQGYKIGIYRPLPILTTTGIYYFVGSIPVQPFGQLQALDFLHDILQEIHLHMMDVAGYDCCSGYPTGSH